ncbi:[NiFe]-hydrogenase assembly chaperone HybE [Aquabacter sp. P-9]|uniref:[NiFe]-hydrogenase assembly chaperone HybE n=1 Tax=Aquabacter sediminis TaxID=3029197 RepID=UPI00237DEA2A|nr:[NiFe]-hydrogenase assembly chaperone HybE [Aquabacter sp. P-9]MDE1568357.1 [NiFe]-hydrogenase assembly chaperone HybE [Aquabacter sp. P-9]
MARFEGSLRAGGADLPPATRLECKICWHVYDPAEGCETWQVPPRTAFADLPDHWRCPVCDGARDQFMVLDVPADAAPAAVTPQQDERLKAIIAAVPPRLEAAFREIHAGQMRGVPMVNETLGVKAVGFRPHEGRALGVLVTPWFMNLVLLPGPDDDWSALATGAKELIEFPSGWYEFLGANRPEVGPYKACSLFSPMFDFSSMLQAVETAQAALGALFDPDIREEGAQTGEIRRRREAEIAAAEAREAEARAAEAETGAAPSNTAPAGAPSDAPAAPVRPTRRDLIFGAGAARREATS